jgi:hypothetical protein
VGFAQSRSPTAINFGPAGTKNLAQKTRSCWFAAQIIQIVWVNLMLKKSV